MQLLQWLALELSKKLGTNPDTGRADQSSDKERSPNVAIITVRLASLQSTVWFQ